VFPAAKVEHSALWRGPKAGLAGSVKLAPFMIGQQSVLCTDSPIKHAFTFTPAFSFFVECASEQEVERLSAILKEGAAEPMPCNNYGFSAVRMGR
jgi:predicted 3-demethylubiquinone-9 3-methyltransferase (glyoxalase superfamily)